MGSTDNTSSRHPSSSIPLPRASPVSIPGLSAPPGSIPEPKHHPAVAPFSNQDVDLPSQDMNSTSHCGPLSSFSTSRSGVTKYRSSLTPALPYASLKTKVLEPFNTDTVLNVSYAHTVRDVLRDKYELCSCEISMSLQDSFNKFNIEVIQSYPSTTLTDGVVRPVLNESLIEGLGQLATKANLTLEDLVRLVRFQHPQDPRPNKRLDPAIIDYLYQGTTHHDLMVQIAQQGFDPVFCHAEPIQQECPDNHKSARTNIAAVTKFIRAGQDDGSLIVLPESFMKAWRNDPACHFHTSPMGVVPKKNETTSTDGRVILDLSWPRNASLNDYTVRQSVPETVWARATEVGRRIHQLSIKAGWDPLHPEKSPIHALIGDVNAAFRNIPNHAKHVKWFGFFVPELKVIVFDMSAPFGWTASPMYYGVFGNGISAVVRRESPHDLNPHLSPDTEPFFCFEWVDDYILIELETPGRLEAAETALRLAMTLTLGPSAIHPRKFADTWEQLVHYLGLDWCLRTCTVSMPKDKIAKAMARVDALLASLEVTKSQLQKLVGSLRHVSTCIPAARPFFQRLQTGSCIPRGAKCPVSVDLRSDCEWFKEILQYGQLEAVPVSIFADIAKPDLHLYMDASDGGLVVLNLSVKEYILLEFDSIEREAILRIKARSAIPRQNRHHKQFSAPRGRASPDHLRDDFSINVREFFSVALAVLLWGHTWHTPGKFFHVKAWIDNAAAVSWCNKLASPNRYGQELLRIVGLSLSQFQIHLSANHMPGAWNHIPDSGSRSMLDNKSAQIWSSFSNSWSRVQVPIHLRHCYQWSSQVSNSKRWPRPPGAPTLPRGPNGPPGVTQIIIPASSIEPKDLSPNSSLSSSNTCSDTRPRPTTVRQSCPRSALSIGVIRPSLVSPSAYPHDTVSPLMAWLEPEFRSDDHTRSTQPSSVPSTGTPSKKPPNGTTSFGAPWSSPTFSASVPANTPALQAEPNTTSDSRMCPSPTTGAAWLAHSRKPKLSTCSSGAARGTGPNEAAQETSTGQATPPAVRSSLRGACARLASIWASDPQSLSARTPTPGVHVDRSLWPSSPRQSNGQHQPTASLPTSSRPTH